MAIPSRHNAIWETREERSLYVRWVDEGLNVQQIAVIHERTTGAIVTRLHRLGLLGSVDQMGEVDRFATYKSLSLDEHHANKRLEQNIEDKCAAQFIDPDEDCKEKDMEIINTGLNLIFNGWFVRTEKGWVRFPKTEGREAPLPGTWHHVKSPKTGRVLAVQALEIQDFCPVEELGKSLPFALEGGSEILLEMRLRKEEDAIEKLKKHLQKRVLQEKRNEVMERLQSQEILDEVAKDLRKITLQDFGFPSF